MLKTAAGKPLNISGAAQFFLENGGAVNLNGNFSGGEIVAEINGFNIIIIEKIIFLLSWTNAAALNFTQFCSGAALTNGIKLSTTLCGYSTDFYNNVPKTNGSLPITSISESGTRKTIIAEIPVKNLVLDINAGDSLLATLHDDFTVADYFSIFVVGKSGVSI